MTSYKPTWDLTTVPDAPLYSEVARRRAAKSSGRPKVMKTCDKCGAVMSARELRAHKCEKREEGHYGPRRHPR